MDYVTARELREKSGEIWRRVEAGEEFVVTRNGKPFALLVPTMPRAVEDNLRALRLARFGEVVREIQAQSVAHSTDQLCVEDIQAEIDAARRERPVRARSARLTGHPKPSSRDASEKAKP